MRSRHVLAMAIGATIAAAVGLDAQRFTSSAAGVRVDVLVTDGNKVVRGLTAADFEVRDEGVIQRVQDVQVEQLPLNVICVFDASGSMAGPRLARLLQAADQLVEHLRPQDRVALLSFASRVRLASPLTGDRDQIARALEQLSARGSTSLRDAAFAGLALRDGDPGRTLMLLFSDGADTSSWLPADRVVDAAKRADLVTYAVSLPENTRIPLPRTVYNSSSTVDASRNQTLLLFPPQGSSLVDSTKFLQSVAEETGGRLLFAGTEAELARVFTAILAEFRDRYVLGFTPTGVSTTGWHTLTVRLKSKKGTVTARRGYFAQ